ncbi:hypothetical protein RBB50_009013 [Rhinocladiella similis]
MISKEGKPSMANGTNGVNGSARQSQPNIYPPGIHVPSLTFFGDDERQEIDWAVQEEHLKFLISSGLHGVVIAGTNGEAATLTAEEKARLVTTTRRIAIEQGRADLPITLGCSAGCTRDVVDQAIAASEAGADFALVLVPSYFHFAMDQAAIVAFFQEVADKSPVGIVIYNFPGVVSGLDVNSEMLDVLGSHRNIVGVKLTCGGIAKVTRAATTFTQDQFAVLAGQSDWLVPALSVGATGCITGCANLFPKTCIEIYNLYTHGRVEEATALQKELGIMEWAFAKGGINGTKWIVAKLRGYRDSSCNCRRPYPKFSSEEKRDWITKQVANLIPIEKRLNLKS